MDVDLDLIRECMFNPVYNSTCHDPLIQCFNNSNREIPINFTCPDYLSYLENPDEMLKPTTINRSFTAILITHSVTFIFGVVGNGLVILVMSWDRKAHNATKLFLMSLAVADLLLLLVCAPLETLRYFLVQWDHKGIICKAASYAEILSAIASILNLSAVSLERFVVIVFPMKTRSLCTMSNCRKALFVVWVASLLLTAPELLAKDTYWITFFNAKKTVTIYYCNDVGSGNLAFVIYRFLILFVGPAILMIICYSWVIKTLWISTVTMQVLTQSNSGSRMCSSYSASTLDSTLSMRSPSQQTMSTSTGHEVPPEYIRGRNAEEATRPRKQVIKMLIMVIILFLICWGPRLIMDILKKQEAVKFSQTVYGVRVAFHLLPFIHSCINPIIYGFMSIKFRRQLMRYCCNRSKRQRMAVRRTQTGISGRSSSAFNSSLYSPMSEYSQRPTEIEIFSNI